MIAYGIEGDPLASASWSADASTWTSNTKNWNTAGSSSFFNTAGKTLVMASATDTKMYRHETGNTKDGTNMTSYIERTGITVDESGQPNASTVKKVLSVWPKMSSSDANAVNVYVGAQMSTV